jgi:hypothetical protein
VKRHRVAKSGKKWIAGAVRRHRGALHRMLGVPAGEKIPLTLLRKASKAAGKLGKRARLALTLRGFRKRPQ